MGDREPRIVIHGRNRYSDSADSVIEVWDEYRQEFLFKIYGGYIETRESGRGTARFEICSKHPDGTDFEHDSSYVIQLEGAGLDFQSMMGRNVYFTGVLLKGAWYDSDFEFKPGAETLWSQDHPTITLCKDTKYYHVDQESSTVGHLLMPFTPPPRKLQALPVEIRLYFGSEDDDA